MTALSIVVPVLNEAESLRLLVEQIRQVCDGFTWEVIFVDDGSRDGSWPLIQALAREDDRIQGLRFRRNFGKAAALTAGFEAARHPLILTMDADLQDDPAEIPRFLAKLDQGFDVVNGWKERRLDPWHKVYPSLVFNAMVSRLTGLSLHDHNCGVKLLKADVVRELRIYGELHRFIPVLAHMRGFAVTELAVHHRPRQFGHSKYGFRRFARGFLDLLTVAFLMSYRQRPLHMLGGVGLVCFGVGALGLGYLAALWVLMNVFGVWEAQPIGVRPLLQYSLAALLLGSQVLSLGLLAELVVYYTSDTRHAFSLAERTATSEPRQV